MPFFDKTVEYVCDTHIQLLKQALINELKPLQEQMDVIFERSHNQIKALYEGQLKEVLMLEGVKDFTGNKYIQLLGAYCDFFENPLNGVDGITQDELLEMIQKFVNMKTNR